MNNTTRKFNTRAFVALMTALSGVGLPLTGIANHLYAFSPQTPERHAWMSAHNALGFLFTVFMVWHAVLNRRAFWNHTKNVAGRFPSVSREAAIACVVVVAVLLLSVGHVFHAGD